MYEGVKDINLEISLGSPMFLIRVSNPNMPLKIVIEIILHIINS